MHAIIAADAAGHEAWVGEDKVGAFDDVPVEIVERAHPWHESAIAVVGRHHPVRVVAQIPALAKENDAGVDVVHGGPHRIHGVHIVNAHEVEPEPVEAEGGGPIGDGVDNEFPHHELLGCGFIAAGGAVIEAAIGPHAEIVAGNSAFQGGIRRIVHMVVYHVHDDANPAGMKHIHELPELPNAAGGVGGVGSIGSLRHVIVHRIIPPVVLGAEPQVPGLVDRPEIKNGK